MSLDGSIYTDAEMAGSHSGCSMACRWLLERIGPCKVIEIGTSYGRQLPTFKDLASEVVCVDPMYDWVPNVTSDAKFDPGRVDQKKIDSWNSYASGSAKLVIGSSYQVHEEPWASTTFGDTKILIIDGCHQPADDVMKDYLNFRKFLEPEHYVIWDDMDIEDVQQAVKSIREKLSNEGVSFEEKPFHHALIMKVNAPVV